MTFNILKIFSVEKWEAAYQSTVIVLRKSTCVVGEFWAELDGVFFPDRTVFLFERMTDWQTGYLTWLWYSTFSQKWSVSLQGKQLAVFVPNDKIRALKWKLEFGKPVSTTMTLMASQYLKRLFWWNRWW